MREVLSRIVPVREVGVEAVYSDAGFLILGFLLEEVFGAEIHEIAQREIFSAWGLNSLGYLPEGPESIAATEICAWRGGLMQGRVHDDNCDVMGGVAGHAGLFGNVRDVYRWAEGWLGDRIDAKVRERFFSPIPGVLRVLGFDRPSPEGSAPLWSPLSVGHLGFTGTSIWMNPLSGKTAVLLTNRVHPSRENPRILELRRAFYRLALE
jgi:CubicO group peptidase (beta-lactamase class C family)